MEWPPTVSILESIISKIFEEVKLFFDEFSFNLNHENIFGKKDRERYWNLISM